MAWLDHFVLAIQAFSALGILFLAAVLVWVARRFEMSSEVLQAPCVTAQLKPQDPGSAGASTDPQSAGVVTVALANVGLGPALEVKFSIQPDDLPQPGGDKPKVKSLPFLKAGGTITTTVAKELPQSETYRFNATYQSLSRKRYLTVITMRNRAVLSWKHTKVNLRRSTRRRIAESES